jgi:hypothetical protein
MESANEHNEDDSGKEDGDDKDGDGEGSAPSEDSPGGIAESEQPKVTGIQDWKRRAAARSAGSAQAMLCEEKIRLLSTPQKQALLIRLIVCDDITPKELDALLGVLAAMA